MIEHPTQALLVFPYQNSECNEGFDITPTESTVLFEWGAGLNTDEYELNLLNLFANTEETYFTSETKIPVVLNRATPYSWYVISRNDASDSIATSEAWKFYNAGEGITSYAPFPAEILSPGMAEIIEGASEVTMGWEGNDIDEDIEGYDVYFSTNNPPDLYASDLQQSELPGVPVEPGQIYYWSVITKDAFGNSSSSGIFQFKVK